MKITPAADRYADFQVQWLQHIRKVAELGLTIAFSDHQEEPEDELIIPPAQHVAAIAITVSGDVACSSETIFAFCHAVARQVFMHQQSRVVSRKQHEMSAECSDEESIDLDESEESLYGVCGAQLHRMIHVRYQNAKMVKTRINLKAKSSS